jgi:hypothetical protein
MICLDLCNCCCEARHAQLTDTTIQGTGKASKVGESWGHSKFSSADCQLQLYQHHIRDRPVCREAGSVDELNVRFGSALTKSRLYQTLLTHFFLEKCKKVPKVAESAEHKQN